LASQELPGLQAIPAKQPGDGAQNEPVAAAPTVPQALAARFRIELEKLNGVFIPCRQAELPEKILSLLHARGVKEIAAWEDDQLPAGLAEALRGAGITIFNAPHAEIRVGISGAVAGVAATATLAIPSGPGRPLTASLLPEIHLAILHQSDLYENLAQVLNLAEVRAASSVALVSGPSRTADIEMTLTLGVHGPGEIVVFCLSD
jgi:L-lactate dehydrogenase complex protein LldG